MCKVANLLIFLIVATTTGCGRFSLDYEEEACPEEFCTFLRGEVLIDKNNSGFFNSFAQDRNGGIHVVYYQVPKRTILWAYAESLKKGFSKYEVIDEAGENENKGLSSKVVVDSQGRPYVIYIRHIEGGVHSFGIYIAWRVDEGRWVIEPWFKNLNCIAETKAEFLDATIDPEDTIHIAYIGLDKRLYYSNSKMRISEQGCELVDPGRGEESRVPFGGAISNCIRIKIDPAGNIHMAYYDSENQNLKYASRKIGETAWKISIVGWERVVNEELNLQQVSPGEYYANLKFPSNESKLDTFIFVIGPGGRREIPKEYWRFRGVNQVAFSSAVVGPGKEFDPGNSKFLISYVRIDTSPDDEGSFCDIDWDSTGNPYVAYYNSTQITLEVSRLKGDKWEKDPPIDNVAIGSNIYSTKFKFQNRFIPILIYPDSIKMGVKSAIYIEKENRWIISKIAGGGTAGLHLFADFLPVNGVGGTSYIRIERDSANFYFSVFDIPKEIKEILVK